MMKKTIITFFVTFFYLNNAHGSENLTVSVASSLYNVSHELAREWEKTSNKKVIIISGSTSLLARQIERGQKSDVIITANYSWLKWMIDKNLIEKVGLSVQESIDMCSNIPIEVIKGVSSQIKLKKGNFARFNILDFNYNLVKSIC